MNIKCPGCQSDMILGNLYGDRYALKWLPSEYSLVMGIWAFDSIKIGTSFTGFTRPRAIAYRCDKCQMTVIPNNGSRA